MEHSNNFDGLRLLGAISVFVSHQFSTVGYPQPTIFTGYLLGLTAVMAFFAISGYLVCGSWQTDPDVRRFANRRGLRIIPAYWAVVGLAPFIVWALTPLTFAWLRIAAYLPTAAFLESDFPFFDTNPYQGLNGSLWSVRFEILCYLLFAACGILFRRKLGIAIAVMLLAGISLLVSFGGESAIRPIWDKSNLGTFLFMGSFFAVGALFRSCPALASARVSLPLIALGALLICGGQSFLGVLAAIPAFVVFVGNRSWPLLRSASRFGDFSYGIFLWGAPVQQLVVARCGLNTNLALITAYSVAFTLIAALLSWHLIEKPSLRLKPAHPQNNTP